MRSRYIQNRIFAILSFFFIYLIEQFNYNITAIALQFSGTAIKEVNRNVSVTLVIL